MGNIPSDPTSFIGRRRELQDLRKLVAASRIVTLVGPGGVGKTRLAIRIASDLERGFADGAWWVDLAEASDRSSVDSALVSALDLRDQAEIAPREIVLRHLRDRQLLLVLDNSEQVLDECAELANHIVRTAPGVRVIATSREPLQSLGEHIALITPFELPEARATSVDQARQNDAVSLFVERAAAASGDFVLTASNQDAVVGICRRLDGLPLAIELAAVRTRVLSAEQIHERLSDRFQLLTRGGRAALPRHQTLRTAIDWSHDLLTDAERRLLRRLAVFAGSFTVSDAESVCELDSPTSVETFELLASLVEKSLVAKSEREGVAVFRLHETMREYAREKLDEAEETPALSDALVAYLRDRCVIASDQGRARGLEFLAWVELEIDNIRAALQTCLATSNPTAGLDIASSIGYFWITRGITEAVRWFDELLAAAGGGGAPIPPRAYLFRGWLSMIRTDPESARPWLDKGISVARTAGPSVELAELLSFAATNEDMAGDFDRAAVFLEEAAKVSAEVAAYDAEIAVLQSAGIHAYMSGDLATAHAKSSAGAELSRQNGDLYYLEQMHMNLGLQELAAGDVARSKRGFVEALRLARQIDNRLAQYYLVRLLGWHATQSHDYGLAARLTGAADALGSASGALMTGPHEPRLQADLQNAADALGPAKFDAEYRIGGRLSRQEAVRLALGETARSSDSSRAVDVGPLGKREVEVAGLIADGLSNKEIATRLLISERTVTTHVQNILNKLGFDSRVQVASWMAANSGTRAN